VLGKKITLKIYIFLTVLNNRFLKEKGVWGGEKAEDSGLYKLGLGGGGDIGGVGGEKAEDSGLYKLGLGEGRHHVVQRSSLTFLKFERQNKKYN
jgi:hypothetical protein